MSNRKPGHVSVISPNEPVVTSGNAGLAQSGFIDSVSRLGGADGALTLTLKIDTSEEVARIRDLANSPLIEHLSEGSRQFLIECLERGLLNFAIRADSTASTAGNLTLVSGVGRLLELLASALSTFEGEADVSHNNSLPDEQSQT